MHGRSMAKVSCGDAPVSACTNRMNVSLTTPRSPMATPSLLGVHAPINLTPAMDGRGGGHALLGCALRRSSRMHKGTSHRACSTLVPRKETSPP